MYNFCPKCGKKNEGWHFCPHCGFDLYANSYSASAAGNLDFAKLYNLSEAAVKEKQLEEQRQRTLKLLQQFEYDEHVDGTYTITKLKDTTALNIVVPEGVIAIGNETFKNCVHIQKITLPNGLNTINGGAFQSCKRLSIINIPASIIEIDYNAFNGCDSLDAVYIEDLTSWCKINFKDKYANPLRYAKNIYISNQLTESINIPEEINEISDRAFFGCRAIKSVAFPPSIQRVGIDTFSDCKLESLNIEDMFTWCKIEFCSGGNPLHYANQFYCEGTLVKNLIIPDGIRVVREGTFAGCNCIETVNCAESIVEIGSLAFANCYNLTNITFNRCLEKIGVQAFRNCTKLNSINFLNRLNSLGDGAFAGCISLKETVFEYSSQLAEIPQSAFFDCKSLCHLTLPDKLEKIDSCAFENCESLTEVNCGENLSEIGKNAFHGCGSLKKIKFGENVTRIGDRAFDGCMQIMEFKIPDSVRYLGSEILKGCKSIRQLTISTDCFMTKPEYSMGYTLGSLFGCSPFNGAVRVSQITGHSSKYGYPYDEYGEFTTRYGDFYVKFYVPSSLEQVCITGKKVPQGFLSGISSITEVTIGDNMESITYKVFEECYGLKSIHIGKGVTSIGESAFSFCSNLTSIIIPSSVQYIAEYAFNGCDGLKTITLPKHIGKINELAIPESCKIIKR